MNPYLLDFTSGSSDITVNKLKTNYLGNISVPLSSLPDVNIITESLASGELLSYNADSAKWSNIAQTPSTYPFSLFQALSERNQPNGYASLDRNSKILLGYLPAGYNHTDLSNIGTNTHAQIDTFISSKSQNNGLASLNSDGKLLSSQIPSLSIISVTTVDTIIERNALTGIEQGDVCVVSNDGSNNGTYINDGTMAHFIV